MASVRHFAGHAITCWLYWVKVMGRGTFGGHTGAEASHVMWSSWEGALFRVIVGAEVM